MIVLSVLSILTSSASGGCSDNNFDNASDVLLLARCSSHLPSAINTSNIGGVSKNVMGLIGGPWMTAINKTTN